MYSGRKKQSVLGGKSVLTFFFLTFYDIANQTSIRVARRYSLGVLQSGNLLERLDEEIVESCR